MNFRDLFQSPAPDVAVEIDHGRVAAARIGFRGGKPIVAAHAAEALPPGAVVPALAALNIADVPVVAQAIGRALAQLGGKPSRVALVIPDTVSKVSLLKLEKMPAKAADLHEIVRWQVRKSAPFPIEQAVLSITPGAMSPEGGSELVVSMARADVVHQYEQACTMAGAHPGLVDLATFSVINGVLAGPSAPGGDWLLVHATDTYVTLAVLRDQGLLFFRNRTEEAEGTLADLIHQTAMYYEDRLHGGGFGRVLLAGGASLPGGADAVRRGLEERLRIAVEPVDPRGAAALVDRIGAAPELLDTLAPLVGLLLRERKVA
ncbi:MAG: pilus assembly protein PilM [Vicinamibacterales bacterium]